MTAPAINLRAWSQTAAQRGWGAGWPSCAGVAQAGTAIVTAPRSGTRMSWHRRIARLASLLIDETERRGFLLKPGQCGAYNCFAGETLVMTPDGDVPIAQLSGTTARVLTRRGAGRAAGGPGRWVDAEIREFGVQPLRRVVLSRRGIQREVFATAEHRWILDEPNRARQERTTHGLRPGQRLAAVHPQSVATRVGVSSVGAAHGIVFGDGTIARDEARVMLCGAKNAPLLRYFAEPHVATYPEGILVGRLPKAWKRLPSVEEGSSYLYGFLAGYFAADGDVRKNGTPRLSSANRETLERVRVLCTRLGIATTGIITTKRLGYGEEVSALYSISLSARHLTADFFLIDAHRERFTAAPSRYMPARWSVVSVELTDRVEPVYCAVVPGTECFALADNLLTGNCRPIANTRTPSNHSWAVAGDINWTDNPYTTSGRHTIPDWMYALWAEFGFANGSMYSGAKDWMHLEFMGTPAQADQMTALAETRFRGGIPLPPTLIVPLVPTAATVWIQEAAMPFPVLYNGDGVRKAPNGRGVHRWYVLRLQAMLNCQPATLNGVKIPRVPVDGEFRDSTKAAVVALQKARGLAQDGVVGPATLAWVLGNPAPDFA